MKDENSNSSIVVEESGTLAQLDGFRYAHHLHMTAARDGQTGIWQVRLRNGKIDVVGQGIDWVTATANAIGKVLCAADDEHDLDWSARVPWPCGTMEQANCSRCGTTRTRRVSAMTRHGRAA